jgi:hypothetical protein
MQDTGWFQSLKIGTEFNKYIKFNIYIIICTQYKIHKGSENIVSEEDDESAVNSKNIK